MKRIMKSGSFNPLPYNMRGDRTVETRDLIIYQRANHDILVIDKRSGQPIVRLECSKPFSRDVLEFIASDCQSCYIRKAV